MNEASDPRTEFSEWLHTELVNEFAHETETWALERVQRVQQRINDVRVGRIPLATTILWIAPPLAFTLAGRYVYLSRALLEQLPSDDALAFVIAHEAAHHDLGHLDLFAGWAERLPKSESTAYVAILVRLLEYHKYGPERENEADAYAVELGLSGGYNGDKLVQALSVLERLALDRGQINTVYGPENLLDPTDPKKDSIPYQVQSWLWTHLHGYHPLHERIANVRRIVSSRKHPGAVA